MIALAWTIVCPSSGVESFLRKYRQRDSNPAGRTRATAGFFVFMRQTSFKMTRRLAKEIKELRKKGSTWRMVSIKFAEMHPDLSIDPGNQIEGMCLCQEAGRFLRENHYEW